MTSRLTLHSSRKVFARLGVTMIEALVVMIIAAAALTAGANLYSDHLDNVTRNAAAQELRRVAKAYNSYLEDHHATLIPLIQANGGLMSINWSDLQPDYLPDEFKNTSPLGQRYVLTVRLAGGTGLEGVVHTENISTVYGVSSSEALEVARLVGADAGYTGVVDPQLVTSSYGQFTLDLADYGVNPGEGSIVYALALTNSIDPGRKYLHRNTMSDPELNRMNTTLNMGGNDISNVNHIDAQTVNAASSVTTRDLYAQNGSITHLTSSRIDATQINAGGLTAGQASITGRLRANSIMVDGASVDPGSGGVSAVTMYTDNWFRSRGPSGWINETYGGGWYMQDSTWIRAHANKSVYTGGTMQAGKMDSESTITATGAVTGHSLVATLVAAENTSCVGYSVGAIAKTGNGELLTCQNNIWKKAGGGAKEVIYGPVIKEGFNHNHVNSKVPLGTVSEILFCSLTRMAGDEYYSSCETYIENGVWYQHAQKGGRSTIWCQAVCLKR